MSYNGFSYAVRTGDLQHWGIKKMRWGVRRYQNPDGTLTALGRLRYLKGDGKLTEKGQNDLDANAFTKANGVKEVQKKATIAPEPKGVKEMTKAQLQSANERAKLEQEYYKNKVSADQMSQKERTKSDRGDKKISEMTDIEFSSYVDRVLKEKELYAAKKDITQFKHEELTNAERVMGKTARYINSAVKVADAVGEVYNVAAKVHNVSAEDKWGFYEKKSSNNNSSGKKQSNDDSSNSSSNNSSQQSQSSDNKNKKQKQKEKQEQKEAVTNALSFLGNNLTYGFKSKKKK